MNNSHMKYRAIISEAWALTQENKKLIWYFAFVPAILSTIVTIVYLGYQALSFWNSPYINPNADHSSVIGLIFRGFVNIFENNPGFGALLIFLGVILYCLHTFAGVHTRRTHSTNRKNPRGAQSFNYGGNFLRLQQIPATFGIRPAH
jgi:hypothetical protein